MAVAARGCLASALAPVTGRERLVPPGTSRGDPALHARVRPQRLEGWL